MAYVVLLKRSAERELERLPRKIHDAVVDHLQSLAENPRPPGIKKLHGREAYRIRIGDYRVLYMIHDAKKIAEVFSVAHRKEVYRWP
jgi:mRNA interferase RelE/StbE